MKTYILESSLPFFLLPMLEQPGRYSAKVQSDKISDGYHTMDELYEHRNRLFLALVKIYDNYITPLGCNVRCWKTKQHEDGTMYEGDFLLGMTVTQPSFNADVAPQTFDISYHLPMRYWHLAKVIELEKAPPYDGYKSGDVLERLFRL